MCVGGNGMCVLLCRIGDIIMMNVECNVFLMIEKYMIGYVLFVECYGKVCDLFMFWFGGNIVLLLIVIGVFGV